MSRRQSVLTLENSHNSPLLNYLHTLESGNKQQHTLLKYGQWINLTTETMTNHVYWNDSFTQVLKLYRLF